MGKDVERANQFSTFSNSGPWRSLWIQWKKHVFLKMVTIENLVASKQQLITWRVSRFKRSLCEFRVGWKWLRALNLHYWYQSMMPLVIQVWLEDWHNLSLTSELQNWNLHFSKSHTHFKVWESDLSVNTLLLSTSLNVLSLQKFFGCNISRLSVKVQGWKELWCHL